MATTYTELLKLPKHATSDPFDITLINNMADLVDAGMQKAYRGKAAKSLVDNGYFPKVINQRGATTTTMWIYCLDRWISRNTGMGLSISDNGLMITGQGTANNFIYQKLAEGKALNGKTITAAVCDGNGEIAVATATFPAQNTTSWTTYATAATSNGVFVSIFDIGSGDYPLAICVGISTGVAQGTLRWVDAFEGSYTAKNLPNFIQPDPTLELVKCQHYLHLYATSAARPAHGKDCSPPMRIDNPTQGTMSIGGVTYYYNSADI